MKTVEINCESMSSRMAFPYKSYFSEDWTDISQGFGDRVLRSKLLNNGMFAAERRYIGEDSGMEGSLFQREIITTSFSRYSNRSLVLTGELKSKKSVIRNDV